MLTDPSQENLFQEEEFEEVRYRKELLPLWFRIMTGLGAVSGFIFALGSIANIIHPEETSSGLERIMMFVVLGIFATSGVACIQLLREKKWAIYAVTFTALFQLLVFSAATYNIYDDAGHNSRPVFISITVIVAILLIFLTKIFFIFKRWLAYQPSVTAKR
ncbi:hypothetical protein [Chitinophaga sp. 22620]|uniref:hypothetical protein n=1 Tax=Chitinophaga sp. 22620 TaxID=3453952 RepID=UPI003F85BA3B